MIGLIAVLLGMCAQFVVSEVTVEEAHPYLHNTSHIQQEGQGNLSIVATPFMVIHVTYDLKANTTCRYDIESEDHATIITFNATGGRLSNPAMEQCNDSFISIEDNGRQKVPFMFCGNQAPPQFVSNGHHVTLEIFQNNEFKVDFYVEALPTVKCSKKKLFRCSDVECISRRLVCNGIENCSNGHDEYCVTDYHVKSAKPVCFLCKRHCIKPRLAFYEPKPKDDLWFLCDGYKHCRDGSDESKDICRKKMNNKESAFACELKEIDTKGNKVYIPRKFLCDNKYDCRHGDDESIAYCQFSEGDIIFGSCILGFFYFIVVKNYVINWFRRNGYV